MGLLDEFNLALRKKTKRTRKKKKEGKEKENKALKCVISSTGEKVPNGRGL